MVTIYIIKRINGRAQIADTLHVDKRDLDFFMQVQPYELDRLDDYKAAVTACKRYNS